MTTVRAHFDGKVLVPDEPVDLPVDQPLELQIKPVDNTAGTKPLQKLLQVLKDCPSDPAAPQDGAAEHDHYLYGTRKRK